MTMHILIRAMMLLVFVGTCGDVWSTNRALATGGAVEANPIMAFLMRIFGSFWIIPRILFGLGNIFLVIHWPATAETWKGVASFGLNIALLAYVIWNNITVGNAKK